MICLQCQAHFCLWCRKIFVADSKNKDAVTIMHNHIFDCHKAPLKEQLLSESVLFPLAKLPDGSQPDPVFVACLLQIRKLEHLQTIMNQGWTPADCKRVILDADFQGLLKWLKEQRIVFREKYPHKAHTLLRMPFNNCVGLPDDFEFDCSTFNPAWQSWEEDGDAERQASIRETRAARKAGTATPPPVVITVEAQARFVAALQTMVDMGFDRQQAWHALGLTNGDVTAAAGMLI